MSWCSNWSKPRRVTGCVTAGERGAGQGEGAWKLGVSLCVCVSKDKDKTPGASQPLLERWLDLGAD